MRELQRELLLRLQSAETKVGQPEKEMRCGQVGLERQRRVTLPDCKRELPIAEQGNSAKFSTRRVLGWLEVPE